MRNLIYVILICLTSVARAQSFVTEEWKYCTYDVGKTQVFQNTLTKQKLKLPTDGRLIAKDTLDNYCRAVKFNYKSGKNSWWGPIVRVGDIQMLIDKYATIQYAGRVLEIYSIIISKKNEEWHEHSAWHFYYCPTVGFYYADNFGMYQPQCLIYILNNKSDTDKDILKVLLNNRRLLRNALECE